MSIPADLKYTKDHEWLKLLEGDEAIIGITDFAQNSLGDITFVEVPEVGDSFEAGESFGVVESVKAASDLYMPVDAEVVEVNEDLQDSPESVNNSPYENGWILKIKLTNPDALEALLDAAAYEEIAKD
ncbi:glycine cleavage system protein GcvH [Pelagicoccus sp. NFK12]|uniref:Glycine cleavage system H protein n=1 Tax=Pelagicoccus enzymogenes TaxID=2773457 RepID=A0A927F9B6_9BACT|nr:glycine cleavage system protein GcvH [Pelagicoccus enzymogenes]MBD5779298.1 glycine cleavage system protein GcvH [Pelagicoccus enzymogenes]MDQ8198350.1 glycine cleavage system protein GcvH [Pelagicoccus enzymogenes]